MTSKQKFSQIHPEDIDLIQIAKRAGYHETDWNPFILLGTDHPEVLMLVHELPSQGTFQPGKAKAWMPEWMIYICSSVNSAIFRAKACDQVRMNSSLQIQIIFAGRGDNPFMQKHDGDAAQRVRHLLESNGIRTEAGITLERYRVIMNDPSFNGKTGLYTLRMYDEHENRWFDIKKDVPGQDAIEAWAIETEYGSKYTRYEHHRYYKIFPADTRMIHDGESP